MENITEVIETGVDRLLELIKRRKKISLPEAAKSLGMPAKVVEEWAEFLDDEKIISIEYRFATPYLCAKVVDKKAQKDQLKEFKTKKEGILRQVESTKTYIENEVSKVNDFKKSLDEIKAEIRNEFGANSKELKKLEKYEELKKAIITDIDKQKQKLNQTIEDMDKKIQTEENKYNQLTKHIAVSKSLIGKERTEEFEIEEKEEKLKEKLSDLRDSIDEISKEIDYEKKAHSLQEEMQSFFGKMKLKFQDRKKVKREKEKTEYFTALHDKNKIETFEKIANEIRVAILKKKTEHLNELYLELRSCFVAIKKSEIDDSIKAKCEHILFETYKELEHLYKAQSYDKNKEHINGTINQTRNNLENIKQNYQELKKTIDDKTDKIKFTNQYVKKFETFANNVTKEVENMQKNFDTLHDKKHNIEKKISNIEKGIVGKVLEKGSSQSSLHGKLKPSDYQGLFKRKSELERLSQRINHDKALLENELKVLIKKAKSMEIKEGKNVDEEINEIQNLIKDIDLRKKEFEDEIQEFNNITGEIKHENSN